MRQLRFFVLSLALALAALAMLRLNGGAQGLAVERVSVGSTPVTIHRRTDLGPAPAVLIAHGFSGSARLMEAFAIDLGQAGYVAVSYDSLGHGRNPLPLTGDVAREDGATERLLAEMQAVAEFARTHPASDGRLAVLGHSMAADIVVRHALRDPETRAVVAVSMFSPAVTPENPRNLLMITGALEAGLTDEALRVLRLSAGAGAAEGETHGAFEAPGAGARRVVFADGVEHVGVLFSTESLQAARDWLDAAFDRAPPAEAPAPQARGPWILALIAAVVALAWPLSAALPRVAEPVRRHGWRETALIAIPPALATPLLLWPVEIRFLPIAVGDYLAMHFALYGALLWIGLARFGAQRRLLGERLGRRRATALWIAAIAAAGYALVVVGGLVDQFVTSFAPTPQRLPLMAALLPGTLLFFLADERLTRAAPRGAYALTKLLFLASLAAAVALNPPRLFFLIILAPPLVLFFAVFGLLSFWAWRRTGHWAVGGLANALVFALAIAATFPMLAG
jgi:hypothetical protein